MKFLKPSWVNHGGKSIFSIDIHPDGTRFATGGQGEDSGKIVIWSMLPVQDMKKESDKSVPKLLCQMDNHLACVNCVRWSNNGRLLASGGDDKLVMIWRYTGGTSRSFGSEQENVETWRCSTTLRGHAGDVLDVAWAPRDVYLATCSVDNTVIVWNAQNFPEQVRMLKGHSGLVKGIAWDPIGKYLASQSDDRSLIVWRTRDWRAEATITKPFAECGGTTHVLRPAWSPEGSLLVSAHAMNNAGPVAKIIERTANWKADMDFVGHRKAVTCVRFNPRVFVKRVGKGSSEKSLHYCCCAIGSRDTSFSVWLTSLKRPLVVMHDMFENSILDLAWNAAGTELLVCSTDGTVGYVQFSLTELKGVALTDDEKAKLLVKFYGQSAVSNGVPAAHSSSGGGAQIIESADVLRLQQNAAAAAAAQVSLAAVAATGRMSAAPAARTASLGSVDPAAAAAVVAVAAAAAAVDAGPAAQNTCSLSMSDSASAQVRLSTKQLETRTPDGKRRITPIFLSPPPDLGDIPLPTAGPTFTTSTEQSKIVVEKTVEAVSRAGAADAAASADADEPPQLDVAPPLSPIVGSCILSIQPMTPVEARVAPSGRRASSTTTTATSHEADEKVNDKAKEHGDLAKRGGSSTSGPAASANRRLDVRHQREKQKRKKQQLLDGRAVSHPAAGATPQQQQRAEQPGEVAATSSVRSASSAGEGEALAAPILPLPPQQKSLVAKAACGTATAFTVEAENDMPCSSSSRGGSSSTGLLHCLRCQSQGKTTWERIVGSRITLLAASRWGVTVAAADQTVTLLSTEGKLIVPPMAVDCAVAVVRAARQFCLVATCKGILSVWNVSTLECIVDRASVAGLLLSSATKATGPAAAAAVAGQVAVEDVQLTDDGMAIVKLRDGSAFCYDTRMRVWLRLVAGNDLVRMCSDHRCTSALGFLGKSGQHGPRGPLATLSATTPASAGSKQKGLDAAAASTAIYQMSLVSSTDTTASVQRLCTVTCLEEQVAAAQALGSGDEYKFWLLSLVRYLTQHGFEGRLRVICDGLLGTLYKRAGMSAAAGSNQDNSRKVLSISKQQLLSEVLPIIGSNLKLQRLFAEYQELADMAYAAMATTSVHVA